MNRNRQVDYEGLQQLVDFQIEAGVKGLLAVGTTGESPTLDWNEHSKVIEKIHEFASKRCQTIAGTGSNSTQEAIEGTAHAQSAGVNTVLLVDPYYNGPSSLEIRREYIEPIASSSQKYKSSHTSSPAEQEPSFSHKTSLSYMHSTQTYAA